MQVYVLLECVDYGCYHAKAVTDSLDTAINWLREVTDKHGIGDRIYKELQLNEIPD